MRELESQIASWRRAMRASGIQASSTLDELEDHLRDDVERRMRLGAAPERAFVMAAETIGQPAILHSEFLKLHLTRTMKLTDSTKRRLRNVLVVIALVAIGLALLLPQLASHQVP